MPFGLSRKRRASKHRLQSPKRLTRQSYWEVENREPPSPRWAMNEDAKLLSLVTKCGLKFSQFTEALPERSAKSMRKRYKKLQQVLKQKMRQNLKENGRSRKDLCDHERILLAHCIYKWASNWSRMQQVFPERSIGILKSSWRDIKAIVLDRWELKEKRMLRKLFLKHGCDTSVLLQEFNLMVEYPADELEILVQICQFQGIGSNLDAKVMETIKELYGEVSKKDLIESLCKQYHIGKPRAKHTIKQHENIVNFVNDQRG